LLVVALLAALPSALAAEPRWTMVRTPSLTVVGDQSPGRLRDVAIQIEQFRSVLAGVIHNADRPLSLPTIVFVFGERKSMQPYVPLYNGKPAQIAGYFHHEFDANVMVLSLEGFEESAAIVYHEFAHLLVANAVRSVPTWLDEGLAEYYSGYRLEAGGKSALIGRPLPHHVLLLRERYMPIEELIAVDRSSALYNEGSKRTIFYAESWALTHYAMNSMPNGAAAIDRYATAIAEGLPSGQAFLEAFGATPADLDKELRRYVNAVAFGVRRAELKDGVAKITPGPARTLTAGEADAWLGDLQRRVGRIDEAAERLAGAMAADSSAPMAHTALGILQLVRDERRSGLDTLRGAAEMAPDEFLTQFLYGAWLLRGDSFRSPDTVVPAMVALKRAVALNPYSADAYAWLAFAQMASTETLPDARSSIERAIQLAPGRIDYRLRWADVRILQGADEEAKAVLTKIAAVRIDPQAAAGAAERLRKLEQFERAEAARRAAFAEAERQLAEITSARTSRSVEVPGTNDPRPPEPDVQLQLRKVGPGEERAYGMLIRVDCALNDVRFHVRADNRTVTATARRMDDVELTQFLGVSDFTVGCGSRVPPDAVYLTWRPDRTPVAGRAGVAVSLEFLPRGYVP
jgi:tetratricopeptide (TPR) repeat protein